MGKIVMLAICLGFGYAWQKGWVSDWVADMRAGAGMTLESERPEPAQAAPPGPAPGFHPAMAGPAVPARSTLAEDCARARNNVQQVQGWMSQGGTVVQTRDNKKLSENETFTALAQNRQFVEDHCRGR